MARSTDTASARGPDPSDAKRPAAQKQSLRDRVGALRNLPPFLRQIWATSPGMTIASLALRLIRALLPVITLYVGKLIIDEALRLVALKTGFG